MPHDHVDLWYADDRVHPDPIGLSLFAEPGDGPCWLCAPGEQRVETVFVKVARGTEAFWLDSEPADDLTVPARGLVLAPGVAVWRVPLIEDACAPEGLGKVLERTPTRTIRHGPRTVADISLGAAARQALAGGSPCLILR
jgi:hypothetical protein